MNPAELARHFFRDPRVGLLGDRERDVLELTRLLEENLFQPGIFRLHSGEMSSWKIECDALTNSDLETLAFMLAERLPPFVQVEGIPRGGLRIADALNVHCQARGAYLLVDDVLTTGVSLTEKRQEVRTRLRGGQTYTHVIGAVLFARGPCPPWITPLFTLAPDWR